jgi:Cdc6-like AAA superfamily ATPase
VKNKITSDKYKLNLREDGFIPIGIDSKNDVIYYSYLENQNLLISGFTGTGKTIFCKNIIKQLIAKQDENFSRYKDIYLYMLDLNRFDYHKKRYLFNQYITNGNDINLTLFSEIENIAKQEIIDKTQQDIIITKKPNIFIFIDDLGCLDIKYLDKFIDLSKKYSNIHLICCTQTYTDEIKPLADISTPVHFFAGLSEIDYANEYNIFGKPVTYDKIDIQLKNNSKGVGFIQQGYKRIKFINQGHKIINFKSFY